MSCKSITNIIHAVIDEDFNKSIKGYSFSSLYGQEGYNILFGIKSLAGDEFWEKYPRYKDFVEEIFINHVNLLDRVDYEGTADAVFYKINNKIFACVRCGIDENNLVYFANNVLIDEKFIRNTSFINPMSFLIDECTFKEAIISINKYIEYKCTEKSNEINNLTKEITDKFVEFYKVKTLKPNFDFSKFDAMLFSLQEKNTI
ncbi:hypothetical protein JG677_02955 [Campylobacter sp. TTU-622]|uniref:hypothetical protein n=1 Tax=Campylobacter sp. TTU-622 TaxID=2800583 RepID=UPI0019052A01|nr:hypothetical protein [Campylobacter sp. TTU-622]MBK1973012.1 hypothetical protein [Campylobacter sp. TTU-622]